MATLRLWTATTTRTTPKALGTATRDIQANQPMPIVVGTAGGGLLPYAIGPTVTVLRSNGTSFQWTAPAPVISLAARGGRVAVASQGSRVTVLDGRGNVASVDLFASEVSAVAMTAKGLLVRAVRRSNSAGSPSARVRDVRRRATGRRRLEVGGVVGRQERARDPPARRVVGGNVPRHLGGVGRRDALRRQRQAGYKPNHPLGSRDTCTRSSSFSSTASPTVRTRPQGAYGQRGRSHAESRSLRRRGLVRSPRCRRAWARAVERGRALGDAGYRPDEFPGRAVFEALGRGQDVSPEHVFAYAYATGGEARRRIVADRPPGPKRDAADAEALVDACDGLEVDRLLFTLDHVWRGEAVLRIEGEADERITDTDAFFRDRHPVLRPQALVPEAERTARAAEEWTRWTMDSSPSTRSRSAARTRVCRSSTS